MTSRMTVENVGPLPAYAPWFRPFALSSEVSGYGLATVRNGIAHMPADRSTPESFFAGSPDGLRVFRAVAQAVAEIAEVQLRVSKSQIAFRRRRGFAYVWRPAQYINSDIPVVLSIPLEQPLHSSRVNVGTSHRAAQTPKRNSTT